MVRTNYKKIHADNAERYETVTTAPSYMEALRVSGEIGGGGLGTSQFREMYAKSILGNRIRPETASDVMGKFSQAYFTARRERGIPEKLGEHCRLAPRKVQ